MLILSTYVLGLKKTTCCACGTATYRLKFIGMSAYTHFFRGSARGGLGGFSSLVRTCWPPIWSWKSIFSKIFGIKQYFSPFVGRVSPSVGKFLAQPQLSFQIIPVIFVPFTLLLILHSVHVLVHLSISQDHLASNCFWMIYNFTLCK